MSNQETHAEPTPAVKAVCMLQPTVLVAEEMGGQLGAREVLLKEMCCGSKGRYSRQSPGSKPVTFYGLSIMQV